MIHDDDYFKACEKCNTLYITQHDELVRGKRRVIKVRECKCGEIWETEEMGEADELFD